MQPTLLKTKKIITLMTLSCFIGSGIPLTAAADTVTVAPNLMVIFGNSYSMNKILGDTAAPQIPATATPKSLHLNDASYNTGVTFNFPLFGSQAPATGIATTDAASQSKLYVAKQALAKVLNDSASDNVNVGLATFRQSFGMEVAAAIGTIKSFSMQVVDQTFAFGTAAGTTTNDLTPSAISNTPELTGSATTQDKTNYGAVSTNFQFMLFWPYYIYSSAVKRSAFLGKEMMDDKKGVFNDSLSTFISGAAKGGLPTKFSAAPVIAGQFAYPYAFIPGTTYSQPDTTQPRTTLMDQNYASSSYGTSSVRYDSYATGNANTSDTRLANFYFCGTGYSSQSNYFVASYLSDKPITTGYATQASSIQTYWVDWNSLLFDGTGTITNAGSTWTCSGYTGNTNSQFIRQSNTYRSVNDDNISTIGAPVISTTKDDSNRAYFSAIPQYYSGTNAATLGAKNGALSGWSGETSYTETTPATKTAIATGKTTANYPSYTANPDELPANGDASSGCGVATNMGTSACRQLITKNYQQTSAKHMGVFLDLPNVGYLDQRKTIAKTDANGVVTGFMALSEMSQSGLDYNPATQVIQSSDGKSRGINASTEPYNSNQSPIYDSLTSALAYYTAYKVKDPYNSCRNNNILLFFDGKEDAHWYTNSSGQTVYADPSTVAKQLKDIGVTTYVVILSNNAGDISAADAIAKAGGSTSAYAASSANKLLDSFKAVFTSLGGAVAAATPTVPPQTGNAGMVYQAAYNASPLDGYLYGYTVNSAGVISTTPVWDAGNSPTMTATTRGPVATLYPVTDATNTAIVNNGTNLLKSNNGTTIVDFTTLSAAAFGSPTSPSVDTIKNYTIDPSYNSGAYLAGRLSGSFIGEFSDQSMMPIVLAPPNNVALISDATYQAYAQGASTRETRVLFQNDDGFLYAIAPTTTSATLRWGWMPRNLVSGLVDYTHFDLNGNMQGGTVIADAPVGSTYATFVLGTAQSGALHYALHLDSNGNPSVVSWINAIAGAVSPQYQAPVISYISTGGTPAYAVYANYVAAPSGTSSQLYVHKVADNAIATSALMPVTTGSTVTSDLQLDNGVFYYGDSLGGVRTVNQGTSAAGVIATAVNIGTTYLSEPVHYVGSYSQNGTPYIWASSDHGVTVFAQTVTGGSLSWKRVWESHVGGAGYWDATGATYTASNATAPSGTAIQSITTGSTITARSVVLNGALIVPVSTPTNNENACSVGNAYYYLYNIDTGYYPVGAFSLVNTDGTTTVQTGNLAVGSGNPMSPAVSIGMTGTLVYGSAQQNSSQGVAPNTVFKNNSSSSTGSISWRELIN